MVPPPTRISAMSPVIAPAPTARAPMSNTLLLSMLVVLVVPVVVLAVPLTKPLQVDETREAAANTNSVRLQLPEFCNGVFVVAPSVISNLPFERHRSPKEVAPFSKKFCAPESSVDLKTQASQISPVPTSSAAMSPSLTMSLLPSNRTTGRPFSSSV